VRLFSISEKKDTIVGMKNHGKTGALIPVIFALLQQELKGGITL
jgi:hypothetical protein